MGIRGGGGLSVLGSLGEIEDFASKVLTAALDVVHQAIFGGASLVAFGEQYIDQCPAREGSLVVEACGDVCAFDTSWSACAAIDTMSPGEADLGLGSKVLVGGWVSASA